MDASKPEHQRRSMVVMVLRRQGFFRKVIVIHGPATEVLIVRYDWSIDQCRMLSFSLTPYPRILPYAYLPSLLPSPTSSSPTTLVRGVQRLVIESLTVYHESRCFSSLRCPTRLALLLQARPSDHGRLYRAWSAGGRSSNATDLTHVSNVSRSVVQADVHTNLDRNLCRTPLTYVATQASDNA